MNDREELIACLKKPQIIKSDLPSFNLYDICLEIGKTNLNIKSGSYPFNTMRQHKFLLIYEDYDPKNPVDLWPRAVVEVVVHLLNSTSSNPTQTVRNNGKMVHILTGAGYYLCDIMRNSDIKSKPRVLPSKDPSYSSSIFSANGANGIINMGRFKG